MSATGEEIENNTHEKQEKSPSGISDISVATSVSSIIDNNVAKSAAPVIDSSVVKSVPLPQRKIRINRRAFHLYNDSSNDKEKPNINGVRQLPRTIITFCSVKDSTTEGKDKQSSSTINLKTENKMQANEKKKVISLASVKKSSDTPLMKSKTSSIISLTKSSFNLNRNGNTGATEVSGSGDPPKKKHKPITWP